MAIALSAVPSMWLSYCHGPNHHGGAGHHHNSRLQGGVKWKHNAKHSFGVMRKLVLLDSFQNKVCVCVFEDFQLGIKRMTIDTEIGYNW